VDEKPDEDKINQEMDSNLSLAVSSSAWRNLGGGGGQRKFLLSSVEWLDDTVIDEPAIPIDSLPNTTTEIARSFEIEGLRGTSVDLAWESLDLTEDSAEEDEESLPSSELGWRFQSQNDLEDDSHSSKEILARNSKEPERNEFINSPNLDVEKHCKV